MREPTRSNASVGCSTNTNSGVELHWIATRRRCIRGDLCRKTGSHRPGR